jgi:hypothetical protein
MYEKRCPCGGRCEVLWDFEISRVVVVRCFDCKDFGTGETAAIAFGNMKDGRKG